MPWKRPENVPYPQTYAIIEGKKPLPNGKMPRFRIQDLPEELFDAALEHMKTIFLFDEPFCKSLDLGKDPLGIEAFSNLWINVMAQKCALVTLLDNADEVNDPTLPKIVGLNMTVPDSREKAEKSPCKHKMMGLLIDMMFDMGKAVDAFNKYNVDVLLFAIGLSVDRTYRGNNLGEEMLRARYPLCRSLGIPLTASVFSSVFSQQAAKRAGMELLLVWPDDYYKIDGVPVFLNCKTDGSHYMAARVQ